MYSDIIKMATGCRDSDVAQIEDLMRDVIYKSTLDWQTHDELADAARLAYCVLRYQDTGRLLPPYPDWEMWDKRSF